MNVIIISRTAYMLCIFITAEQICICCKKFTRTLLLSCLTHISFKQISVLFVLMSHSVLQCYYCKNRGGNSTESQGEKKEKRKDKTGGITVCVCDRFTTDNLKIKAEIPRKEMYFIFFFLHSVSNLKR